MTTDFRFTAACNIIVGMGDTDDTSIYRDTKISRYWYRVCLDTFWYRDTIGIFAFIYNEYRTILNVKTTVKILRLTL